MTRGVPPLLLAMLVLMARLLAPDAVRLADAGLSGPVAGWVICHAGDTDPAPDAPSAPHSRHHHDGLPCPVCQAAAMQPGLAAASPPVLAPPRRLLLSSTTGRPVQSTGPPRRAWRSNHPTGPPAFVV